MKKFLIGAAVATAALALDISLAQAGGQPPQQQPQRAQQPQRNIVNRGGAGIVAAGGGNIVAAGGGNAVARGGNLIGQDGAGIVAAGGGNLQRR